MYDRMKKELKQQTIFKIYLNEEKRLKLCEVIRITGGSSFLFFDETDEKFSEMLDDIERKLEKNECEYFHYQELTHTSITLYKEKGKYIFFYENNINDYINKKVEDKSFIRLLSISDYILK